MFPGLNAMRTFNPGEEPNDESLGLGKSGPSFYRATVPIIWFYSRSASQICHSQATLNANDQFDWACYAPVRFQRRTTLSILSLSYLKPLPLCNFNGCKQWLTFNTFFNIFYLSNSPFRSKCVMPIRAVMGFTCTLTPISSRISGEARRRFFGKI